MLHQTTATKKITFSEFPPVDKHNQLLNTDDGNTYSELEQKLLRACSKLFKKDKFSRMKKEKKDSRDLMIQGKFQVFLRSKDFSRLIISIYDYCTDLNKIEKKNKILEEEAKDRINAPPQLLASEIQRITSKAKECSIAYSLILLHWGNLNDRNKDQNFFDCMIYIVERIMEDFFDRVDYPLVKEEINRLFRTNTFNIQKRRHIVDEYIKQYPQMAHGGNLQKENPEKIIAKVESRFNVPNLNMKIQMNSEKSEIRPMFVKNTPCGSYKSRSPLVALLYPSIKEQIHNYHIDQKKRQNSTSGTRVLEDKEVSYMIKHDRQKHSSFHNPFSNQQKNTNSKLSMSFY